MYLKKKGYKTLFFHHPIENMFKKMQYIHIYKYLAFTFKAISISPNVSNSSIFKRTSALVRITGGLCMPKQCGTRV